MYQFSQQNSKNGTCMFTGKKTSTATLNIAQTAHFHNYRSEVESPLQIWLAPQTSLVEVVVQFWTRFSITWFNIRTEFGQKMHSLEKYYMCTGNSTNWLFLRLFARVQFRGEESRGKLFSEVKVPTFAKESKSWCFQNLLEALHIYAVVQMSIVQCPC